MTPTRTSRARIKGQLRQMWVRSYERAAAMKRDNYSCAICGIKQSKKKGSEVKINIHHTEGIDIWDNIIDLITQHLLCDPNKLQTLCEECHITHKYTQNTPNTAISTPNTPPHTG